MPLQTRRLTLAGRWIDHFYLCHYKPRNSSSHDKLSDSLLKFKHGHPLHVRAWTECAIEELGKQFEKTDHAVMCALGHDCLSCRSTDPLTIFAGVLAEKLSLPNCCKALAKKSGNRKLSLLTREQRFQEMREVYYVQEDLITTRFLVIDDIFTTGATASAILRAIYSKKADANIKLFTFAYSESISQFNRSVNLQGSSYYWQPQAGWSVNEDQPDYGTELIAMQKRILENYWE